MKLVGTVSDLSGKVAIVTGASRGIGASLALELAKHGAKLACVARGNGRSPIEGRGTSETTAEKIRAIGGEAISVAADMGVEAEINAMIDQVFERFGRIDILVNNAGVVMNSTNLFSDISAIDNEMNVNLRGPFLAMRAAVPYMRKTGEGRILNISSSVALNVAPTMMTYGVSKLALERLTIDVADQLQQDNVSCNSFRIDVPVHNSICDDITMFDGMRPYFEPEITAVDGMIWMLQQAVRYTGHLDSISGLRQREGIMPQLAEKAYDPQIFVSGNGTVRTAW